MVRLNRDNASLKKGAANCTAAQPLISQYGPVVEQGCAVIGGGSVNTTTTNTISNNTTNTTTNATRSSTPSPKEPPKSSGMHLEASLILVLVMGFLI